jgi:hypothetical protein
LKVRVRFISLIPHADLRIRIHLWISHNPEK